MHNPKLPNIQTVLLPTVYAKKVNPNIYFNIFFYFLSEIVRLTLWLCILIFVYFSEFSVILLCFKNCVYTWHGTSNLLPLLHHFPAHHVESKPKGHLWHHKVYVGWNCNTDSLLSAWPYTEEVRIISFLYVH